jgi:hypothetical protein
MSLRGDCVRASRTWSLAHHYGTMAMLPPSTVATVTAAIVVAVARNVDDATERFVG